MTVSLNGRSGSTGALDLLSEEHSLECAVHSRVILFGWPVAFDINVGSSNI